MKTCLLTLKKNVFAATVITSKLYLLVFAALFCFSNGLYAGVKPVSHGRHIKRAGRNASALVVHRSDIPNPPTIGYASPQVLTAGQRVNITPTMAADSAYGFGIATANAAVCIPNTTTLGILPIGLAIDGSGNFFVTQGTEVDEISPSGTETVIATGFNSLGEIALDGAGTIYVVDNGASDVIKLTGRLRTKTVIATGLSNPFGIAVDPAGDAYVSEYTVTNGNYAGDIKRIQAGTTTATLYGAVLAGGVFNGVALDAQGDLFIADGANEAVEEIPADGGGLITVLNESAMNYPVGYVTVDKAGTLFVQTFDGQGDAFLYYKFPGTNGATGNFGGFVANITQLAIGPSGSLYAACDGDQQDKTGIMAFTPSGGYFINKNLPQGLNFDGTTGIISGIPLASSPATDYTVTAYQSNDTTGVITSASAVINITVNAVTGPQISYNTPLTYSFDYAAPPTSPINSGGMPGALNYMPTASAVGSGFNKPNGIAKDAAGNLYIADRGSNEVKKMTPGGSITVIGSGFSKPTGVAVDAAGNVYVADNGNNAVKKIPAGSNTPVLWGSGFKTPLGIAVDIAGNVYVADKGNGEVKEISTSGVTTIIGSSGFTSPTAVALDGAGNVYVVDSEQGSVERIPPGGGSPQLVTFGLSNPFGIAVDNAGDIFVATVNDEAVYVLIGSSYLTTLIGQEFFSPQGIMVDSQGNLYIADTGNNEIRLIQPAGGYFFNRPLPSGLSYDGNTGIIGGTPLVITPAASYIATAWNPIGSSSTAFSLQVTANALLSGLTLSSGTLSPVFSPGTNAYTASVANNITSITVTPVVYFPTSTVQVNGTAVTSGTASGAITLNVGANMITTVVTAEDGTTMQTYTVTVTRLPSSNAALSALQLSAGTLTPAFTGVTTGYTAGVANGVAAITVTPATADPTATVTVNGTAVTSGSASQSLPLVVGPNAITIVVKAQDGTTMVTYTVSVTRFPPSPAISYTSPQNYARNAAITPLSPVSSNVAAPGYNSVPVVIGSGFSGPAGVATDAAGDVFIADYGNKLVKKIPAGSNTPTSIGSGFTNPFGVAVDAAGNVYVADYGASAVYKIPAGNGTPVTIGSGFSHPTAVAVDAAGDVYVADHANNAVKKIPAGSNTPVAIGSGFSGPIGIAVDAAGNVYVGDKGTNSVKKIPAGGNAPVVIGSGFSSPYGVAVDASGNVFVIDYGNNAVKEIPAGSTTPIALGAGFKSPEGVAADGAGNVYVADYGNDALKQIKPLGGYYIGPFLPAGLSFANTTGIISGTPTVASPATIYTVTAYNSFGGNAANLNITVTRLPIINYTSPQIYTQGTAITPLAPTNVGSGVAAPGYNSTPVVLGTGFSGPAGVAADAAGDVFVADYGNKLVKEIPAGSTTPIAMGSGFTSPFGVTVDAAGDLYVADYGASAVYKIPAGNGSPVTIGSGFSHPTGVAVDAAGDVFVADHGNNAVKKIPAGSNTPAAIGSGFSGLIGIAVDASGNVYVGDSGNNAVKEIYAGSNTPVAIGSGFSSPYGVAVDASGNVFVADYGNNAVKEIPAGSTTPVTLGAGFKNPEGVAADGAGNVYVADQGNNTVKQIKPAGGYYIGPFLPAGLNFANTTGILSGTPAVACPATNYTVTAYNSYGGNLATVNVSVKAALPAIGYSSPQPYAQGIAITPLAPTSNWVAAPGYSSSLDSLGSGFSGPTGVAVDASGNIYIADFTNKLVKKIPAGSNTPVVMGSGFTNPFGVAVDAAGDVYVADYGAGAVYKIPAGNGTPVTIGSGFNHPTGVAVDAAGDVYVADYDNSAVKKIAAGSNTPAAIGSGFNHPSGVALDAAGNLYITDEGNNAVKKIPVGSNTPAAIGSGFSSPIGIAVDASGNVFVGDKGNNVVKEIPAGSNTPAVIASGFNAPHGVAANAAGNIYVADFMNNAVKQIKPVGGYYVGPFLPAGLSFNNTTGIFTGTPTVVSPAANYTVTAYNPAGGGTAIVNITVTGTPAISYTGPQIYTQGTAIAPLAPVSSNIAAPGYSSSPVGVGGTFYFPTGIAADASGNVYVTDNGGVIEILAGSNTTVVRSSGDGSPWAVALDAAGDVYVSDYSAGVVYKTPVGSVTPVTIASGFSDPTGLAVDAAGNVYVASKGNNAVYKIPAGSNTPVAIGSGFNQPSGVSVDASGDLYISDQGSNSVKKIPAGSNTPVTISSGFKSPTAVAVDASGNVFVVDYGNVEVKEMRAGGTSLVNIGSGFAYPESVATDGAGNVYVGDNVYGSLVRIKPVGGYYIGPFLPAGLTFNNTTGVISGTPTVSSPATNYTVSGYNFNGSTTATVNIKVLSNNANLSNLVLSSGPLTPVFATATTGYTANVANSVASVTVTPTTSDPNAAVTVNTVAVTSGTPAEVPLSVGGNVITTVVSAQNGVTTKTYTLTVTRAPGSDDAYQPVSVANPTNSVTIADDGIVVHPGVSPNGDGIDDFLQIDNITSYPNNKLSVMNRNGQLIFEATGYDNSTKTFDGHSNKNGQMQLPGTYFYQLAYTVKGTIKYKTGFIILKY
jgi:gliding motility-associated-like protein